MGWWWNRREPLARAARSAASLGGLVCAVAFVALAVLSPIYGHADSDYECQFEDATSLAYKTRDQYARLGYWIGSMVTLAGVILWYAFEVQRCVDDATDAFTRAATKESVQDHEAPARTLVPSAPEAKDDEAVPHVVSTFDRAVESLDTVGTIGPPSAIPQDPGRGGNHGHQHRS